MSMQITDITIHPTNDGLVRAYVDIVFDNCFMVGANQSHARPHRTIRLISFQEAKRMAPIGSLLIRPMLRHE